MLPSLKMAALCAGNYGLTQQHSGSTGAGDNKELIFVKLTDSALRAIEEFQRNQVGSDCSLSFEVFWVLSRMVKRSAIQAHSYGSKRSRLSRYRLIT